MSENAMHTKQLHIIPIPAFEDNYIWLLHNKRDAIVIDPGDAKPVLETLKKEQLRLCGVLITHHHADHIDGVQALQTAHPVPTYAPKYEQYAFDHTAVVEGDTVEFKELGVSFDVLWLPGHTLGHIAYYNASYLFCGDVLFSAGCGRLFEGSREQMLNSLNRLKKLNPATQVFCTHEYTMHNIGFALTLEPNNPDLNARKAEVIKLRKNNHPSLPTTISQELKTNPFLRCKEPDIIANSGAKNKDELSIFSKIRTLRNHY